MRKIFNKKALGIVALALVCVLAGTAIGAARPTAEADTVVLTSPFTEAIAKVRDSVIGVYNYQIVNNYGYGYSSGNGYGTNPFDFFGYGYGNGNGNGNGNGRNQQENEVKYASGSGVVIAKEYVLTNYHVIEGSSSLKISIAGDDSNLYEATVAASDSDKDLAVLYVPGLPLEPVELGDSDQLVVGDWAICIGNAIGLNGTVTAGIISALDREVESETTTTDRFGRKSNVVNTMIQTDAAINSGNSGGGMFNTAGQLVGIPTLKYSGTRYSSGASVESIGMCIPINDAKDLIEEALGSGQNISSSQKTDNGQSANAGQNAENGQVPDDGFNPSNGNGQFGGGQQQTPETPANGTETTQNGRVGKPRLGVTVTTLTTNGTLPNGAYIISVEAGSPAEKAGLKAGDTIVELNGQVLSDTNALMSALEGSREGDTVTVTVWRPNEVQDAENASISVDGQYVENIEVVLAVLDGIA